MFVCLAQSICCVWTVKSKSVGWVKSASLNASPSLLVAQQEHQIWVGGKGSGRTTLSSPRLTTQRKTSSLCRRYSISPLRQNILLGLSELIFWFPACPPPPPPLPPAAASFPSASNRLQFLKFTSLPYQCQHFIYLYHETHTKKMTPNILTIRQNYFFLSFFFVCVFGLNMLD